MAERFMVRLSESGVLCELRVLGWEQRQVGWGLRLERCLTQRLSCKLGVDRLRGAWELGWWRVHRWSIVWLG